MHPRRPVGLIGKILMELPQISRTQNHYSICTNIQFILTTAVKRLIVNKIDIIDWPAYSTDLNCTEKVGRLLIYWIYGSNLNYSIAELKETNTIAWN